MKILRGNREIALGVFFCRAIDATLNAMPHKITDFMEFYMKTVPLFIGMVCSPLYFIFAIYNLLTKT
jgi:hypothetical protein